MAARKFEVPIRLPSVGSLPASPAAGDVVFFGGQPVCYSGTMWVPLGTFFFNSSGLIADGRDVWLGTGTTDANGDVTVTYTGVTFSSAPQVFATGIRSTTTPTEMVWASRRSGNATSSSWTIIRGNNIGLLGADSIRRAPSGLAVDFMAVGT